MVSRMKLENGSTDWAKYRNMEKIGKLDIILIVKALKELKIVEDITLNSTSIRLTETGWQWPGFKEQRRISHEEKQTQDQINQLTLKKLKLEQFPAKFWWLLILITAGISVLTTWVSNRIEDSRQNTKTHKSYPTNSLDSLKK